MNELWHWAVTHPTPTALVSLWLFSNVVTAMPSPSNESSTFYKFFFALMHGLSGSLPRVFPMARVFNDPTRSSQTYFAKPNGAAEDK